MTIKETWTYNHKHLLVTISLVVAIIIDSGIIPLPTIEASTVEYIAVDNSIKAQIERRAYELYDQNRAYDLERYRHDALVELSESIEPMLYDSPF